MCYIHFTTFVSLHHVCLHADLGECIHAFILSTTLIEAPGADQTGFFLQEGKAPKGLETNPTYEDVFSEVHNNHTSSYGVIISTFVD